ncbi:MAG TPA: VOC family protein [Mycobacterium sp.]
MPTRSDPWPAGTPCWVDIAVPDVQASVAFYAAVCGWSFLDSGEDSAACHICQVNGRAAAAIGPRQNVDRPTAWTVYLASDDADSTARAVVGSGGTLLDEPFDVPGNGRMCIAQDPLGAAFGVWQANGTIGAEVYAEPGGLVWTDLRLPDPDTGRTFYTAVFGYQYQAVQGAGEDYTTFHLGEAALGGIGGMMGAPAGTQANWLAYFAVRDTSTAVAAATAGGGTLLGEPDDTPFGRMAFLADPDGARFALIGPAVA